MMKIESGPRRGEREDGRVRYVLFILFFVNVFNYVDRMALAILLPAIKADLDLSDGQLGILVGLAFALFYAVCGIPIARWADRGTRRDIIAIGLATWSVMTALSGLAQNFWHLLIARIGVGAGEAGCVPTAQSIICDYVPVERRSGALAIHNFGLIIGMMFGMVLAGRLGEVLGWRWTFVSLGLPGIALAMIVRLTLKEPPRGAKDLRPIASNASAIAAAKILFQCRPYRLLMCYFVVNGFAHYGLTQWWPSFYARSFGLPMSLVGGYYGISMGVGSGIGVIAGGILGDRAAKHNAGRPLALGAGAAALAVPAALVSLTIGSFPGSIASAAVTGLLWSLPTGAALAATYSVVPPQLRATAGALMIFFTSVFGFGLGPSSVGVLSDALAPLLGTEALRYALLAPVGLLPMAVYFLLTTVRALRVDATDGKASGATCRSPAELGNKPALGR